MVEKLCVNIAEILLPPEIADLEAGADAEFFRETEIFTGSPQSI